MVGPIDAPTTQRAERCAFVVVIWGELPDHVLAARVLGASLQIHAPDVPRIALVTQDVPPGHRAALGHSFDVRIVNDVEADRGLFASGEESAYFARVFTKLRALELVEFDKVLRAGLRGGGGVGMGVSGMVFVGLVLGCIEAKFYK